MSPIENYTVYTNGMKRAMYDKLFFVDKIDPTMIVDFGCADGQLMHEINPYFPNIPIVGVDNDLEMREQTIERGYDVVPSLSAIKPIKGAALIVSSVLHELYSYGKKSDVLTFWHQAMEYDYIVIRDMALSTKSMFVYVDDEHEKIVKRKYREQARDFEELWGSMSLMPNFMHFLLKYRYTENWTREVQENYLPNTMESIMLLATIHDREVVYQDHYVLPYLQEQWKKDFGITVTTPTHLKLITKKVD